MLIEELRPKNLEDYIGNDQAISSANAYMNGSVEKQGVIFVGQPGTGKTTLAHILAKLYNFQPIEINASLQTKKSAFKDIHSKLTSLSLDGKQKLLIMDECENANSQLLTKLLELPLKVILICNEIQELHWSIKRNTHHVVFELPTKLDYISLLEKIGVDGSATSESISKFNSYRDVLNWVEGGDASSPRIFTELQEMKEMFAGNEVNVKTPPVRVLEYYLFNGGDPDVASRLDMMSRNSRHKQIVKGLRLKDPIKMPYRYFEKREKKKQIRLRVLGWRDE